MTDDFLSMGLQSDRYLKAVRLADQFEDEIRVALQQVGEEMIAENPELFDSPVEGMENVTRSSGSVLAVARIDYPMNRVQSEDNGRNLRLNVHLYWCDPTQYNRADIDGALRAFGYKIKRASKSDDERVAAQTREWALQVAKDPFSSGRVFYRHVSSVDEIEQTGEKLVEHFSEFGSEYGIEQME
jgi:hypothetical protein